MKLSACLAAAAMAVAVAAPAFAKDLPSGGLTREDVMNWLRDKGYAAEMKYDETAKDNYVSASSDGVNWSVYLYGCTDNRCTSFQYSAGWSDSNISEASLGVWNRVKRFIRAYRNSSNSVYGEYDFDLVPGGTWEMLDQSLDRWKTMLTNFKELIDQGNAWANGR